MKNWRAQDWVAFILACTVPFFILSWLIGSLLGVQDRMPEEAETERIRIWIGVITSLITGLLVWLSNNQKNRHE